MLTSIARPQFAEKILTDQYGRQYRVVFLVTVIGGEIKGRVVSVHPLAQNSQAALVLEGTVAAHSDGVLCLPAWTDAQEIETPYFSSPAPAVSPYFSHDYLITSQPTRAPSRT